MMHTRYAEEEDAASLLELLRNELDDRLFMTNDWEVQVREDLNESSSSRWLLLEEEESMVRK